MRTLRSLSWVLLLGIGACTAPRKTIYFAENNIVDSGAVVTAVVPEAIIKPDDVLAINVTSESSVTLDKDPVAIFKDGGTSFSVSAMSAGSGTSVGSVGYLVDADGNIDFPLIGKLLVGGKTVRQAKAVIAQRLAKDLRAPVIELRIINYRVSVLGEVPRPGPVIAPNHKITILDALAAAGDIPISGRKDNVMVIREEGGIKRIGRIDLNNLSAFQSPYYYLKQNDIVYVEPNRVRRQQTNDFTQVYLPVVSTVLTTLLTVYGIVQISRQ